MKTVMIPAWGLALALSGGLLSCMSAEPEGETLDLDVDLDVDGARAPEELGLVDSELSTSLDDSPAPSGVYIESITTGGAGCPSPNTVSTLISSDRKTFLVIFDDMLLENPPEPAIKHLNCVAGMKLHVPGGWQLSVAGVTTRGYAYLSKGIKARQTSNYIFAGNPLGQTFETNLKGYYDDNYSFTDFIGVQSSVWSPCGASVIFAVNTSLNLNAKANPDGVALFNTETLDGAFKKLVHWKWKKCKS